MKRLIKADWMNEKWALRKLGLQSMYSVHTEKIHYKCIYLSMFSFPGVVASLSWINNGCGSGPRSQVWSQWWKWDKTLWPHVYLSSDGPNCCNYPHFFGSNGNWCQSGTDGCHFAQEAIAKVSFLFSITPRQNYFEKKRKGQDLLLKKTEKIWPKK